MLAARRIAHLIAAMTVLCASSPANAAQSATGLSGQDTPVLTISRDTSQLAVTGSATSIAHTERMAELARTLLPEFASSIDLQLDETAPAGWSLLSEMALRAAAEAVSVHISINESQLTISGFVADRDQWQDTVQRVENSLIPGMTLLQRVTEIDPDVDFATQCLRLATAATAGTRIEFALATADLKANAVPVLDELAEILTDCPAVAVTVTGHTDSSGDAAMNQALSRARADVVARYLTDRGVAPGRLVSIGAGSTLPLAQETTARNRARNRRIQFAFSVTPASDTGDP